MVKEKDQKWVSGMEAPITINVINWAIRIGLLYEDSKCKVRMDGSNSYKVNLIFPHVLFKDYFIARWYGSKYEEGTTFEKHNSQTYLSYFITGFSPKYRKNIFKWSFDKNLAVLKMPYIAHAEGLDTIVHRSKKREFVLFTYLQPGDNKIVLPSTVIGKVTFSPKCDLRITGAVLTDDIKPFSTCIV